MNRLDKECFRLHNQQEKLQEKKQEPENLLDEMGYARCAEQYNQLQEEI